MSDTIYGAIIGVCGTIVGLVGGYFISASVAKRDAFNKAARGFRLAFWDEIEILESIEGLKFPHTTIREVFSKHSKAQFEFRHHLHCQNGLNFERAWDEYKKYYETNIKGDVFEEVFGESEFPEKSKEKRDELLRLINNLLEYAKPK